MNAADALLHIEINGGQDMVTLRQRARQVTALLGFGTQDQVRVATAVSEVARCLLQPPRGGVAVFALPKAGERQELIVTIRQYGNGARAGADLAEADALNDAAVTAQRLMDGCEVATDAVKGITVTMRKALTAHQRIDAPRLAALASELAAIPMQNTFSEMEQQNRELADALAELRQRQDDLVALTHELEDTNRGVVALYAEIEEKAERLRHADEMKSRFLSNTSHELRTPLSSIRALSKVLLDRMDGELTVEQERQVTFIANAARDLSELVNDLLDLAKIEAGKVAMEIAPIDVGGLFAALKGMLQPLALNPEVELVVVLPAKAEVLVSDDGKLAQILRNFIANALKFTERGAVTLALEPHADPDCICFAVSDTGIGIAPDNLHLIFEEFSQIEHALQRRSKGTGLGLPLCRKLAALLGGDVKVSSAVGVGSTFYLTLPRRYAGAEQRNA
jgi:signal transduction histidine kinase